MALRKTLIHRLLGTITKPTRAAAPSSKHSSLLERIISVTDVASCPFRRFLHQNNLKPSFSPLSSPVRTVPLGERLIEKLRSMNGDRMHLDAVAPPRIPPEREGKKGGITVEEVRKVLKVSQIEEVKARLRNVRQAYISYGDFVQICRGAGGDVCDGSLEHGLRIAKQMDESGAVLVLGNLVFIKPELVARAIETVITTTSTSTSITRKEQELQALEEEKNLIDGEAVAGVKKELWGGLGFLVIQTVGFMRLTFWELSWDVMEPICFYVTSIYFMAGYAFFLRTSKDPSFEGFFESRFAAKQKRLMKMRKFDLDRFLQLRKEFGLGVGPSAPPCEALGICSGSSASRTASSLTNHCDCHRKDVLGLAQ